MIRDPPERMVDLPHRYSGDTDGGHGHPLRSQIRLEVVLRWPKQWSEGLVGIDHGQDAVLCWADAEGYGERERAERDVGLDDGGPDRVGDSVEARKVATHDPVVADRLDRVAVHVWVETDLAKECPVRRWHRLCRQRDRLLAAEPGREIGELTH